MSRSTDSHDTSVQPALADLMARYLERQAEAQAAGLGTAMTGEVTPFEAAPAQTVDPRLAWDEALAAVRHFQKRSDTKWQAPPDWPVVVAAHEPTVALAFALGNYPQLVRHLRPMMESVDLGELRPTGSRPVTAPNLIAWAAQTASKEQYPQLLLAIGALRLARQFEQADELVRKHGERVPEQWKAAWANEVAALAWHRGRGEEALALWQAQPASLPVLFNRGMAALFLNRPAEAHAALNEAIASLPETSAWHHLGRLYLTLAEMRK
ncbi:MAG: hypothetical protein K2R98_09555 [Gemmataceae bacterium]|nr:hypothetical protein [Gemmataceae bacterium]